MIWLPSYLIKTSKNIECKTDNHILLVVPGVQATEHQTKALDDRKQTRVVGDHGLWVETELPERLQPFTEGLTRVSSSSTDVSPADVEVPPPVIPLPAHLPAETIWNKAGGQHNLFTLFRKTRIAKDAVARKLRRRHAEEILTIGRTEVKLPKDLAIW